MKKFKRIICLSLGSICVALAIIGVFVPLLPTTPFFLLAFALFSVEPKFQEKLQRNKYYKEYVSIYRAGEPIPKSKVIKALSVLWIVLFISMYSIQKTWSYYFLSFIGIAVSIHILYVARGKRNKKSRK